MMNQIDHFSQPVPLLGPSSSTKFWMLASTCYDPDRESYNSCDPASALAEPQKKGNVSLLQIYRLWFFFHLLQTSKIDPTKAKSHEANIKYEGKLERF